MENKTILTDDMLKAAFAFRKSELWNELDDSDIFAVTLSNGEVGYCCVMGYNNSQYALGLYVGQNGFKTYLNLIESASASYPEMHELAKSFDCINVFFEDGYEDMSFLTEDTKNVIENYAVKNKLIIPSSHGLPIFSRVRPAKVPTEIYDSNDAAWITEALNAAVEVARKVRTEGVKVAGFDHGGEYASKEGGKLIPLLTPLPDGQYQWGKIRTPEYIPDTYFNPDYMDDDRLEQLDAIKKKGLWQCRVAHFDAAVRSQIDGISYFPLSLFAVDRTNGNVPIPIVSLEEEITDETVLLDRFADKMIETGLVPRTIEVNDPRTYALLEDFCVQEGIHLNMVANTPQLDQFILYMNESTKMDD